MLFGNDRTQIRQFFCAVWRKYSAKEVLEPLEGMIAEVIRDHPEYQPLLDNEPRALDEDYQPELGESNPFLHMGIHIAIREQLGADRPAGIRVVYRALLSRLSDAHAVEHRMMECLGEALWQAQRSGGVPDEAAYLDCLKHLANQ